MSNKSDYQRPHSTIADASGERRSMGAKWGVSATEASGEPRSKGAKSGVSATEASSEPRRVSVPVRQSSMEDKGEPRSISVQGEDDSFLLALLSLPHSFPDEALILEDLLEAGLPKLHIRKPDASEIQLNALLSLLSPRWSSRLVLHGSPQLAKRYHIPQLHGSVAYGNGQGRSGGGPFIEEPSAFAVSTSAHSWTEFRLLPPGLSYAFISPLFDSISKPGYAAGTGLLQQPAGILPCTPVGLGGIGADSLGEMIRMGWKGAAVLGYIWEEPKKALPRFLQLKKIIDAEEG